MMIFFFVLNLVICFVVELCGSVSMMMLVFLSLVVLWNLRLVVLCRLGCIMFMGSLVLCLLVICVILRWGWFRVRCRNLLFV